MDQFIKYIKKDPSLLSDRRRLMDMLSIIPDRAVYPDKPRLDGGIVYATKAKSSYGYYDGEEFIKLTKSENSLINAPFATKDKLILSRGDIANYTSTTPLTTSIGRYIANWILYANPFGNTIQYVNEPFTRKIIGGNEEILGSLMLDGKVTVGTYLHTYIRDGYDIGHFAELINPSSSEKTITAPKSILDLRDKLLEENKDKLDDPKVVSSIEQTLIAKYKEYVGDDPAGIFLEATGKGYNNHAKSMNIMQGGLTAFGGDAGEVSLIKRSLSEGWVAEDFAAQINSMRRGAYSRGVETQDGGALTKLVFRAFQDVSVIPGDCKTRRTTELVFNDVIKPNDYIGRTIYYKSEKIMIDSSNYKKYVGKTVELRTPEKCKMVGGYCTTCVGDIFRKLKIVNPGTLTITITSAMMSNSMAAMFSDNLEVFEFDPMNYIV